MENIDIYNSGKQKFYCLEVVNSSQKRDNLISEVLDEIPERIFFNSGITYDSEGNYIPNQPEYPSSAPARYDVNIIHATFYKDPPLTPNDCKIVELTQKEFIELIPDEDLVHESLKNDYYYQNLEIKKQELELINSWEKIRKQYKAISAYERVDDPKNWKPCKNCGLIPLVWAFNNGNSTACGCGENEYRNHSIRAESIMSYVTRNSGSSLGYGHRELRDNWNTWVETGEDLFLKKKESIPEIW